MKYEYRRILSCDPGDVCRELEKYEELGYNIISIEPCPNGTEYLVYLNEQEKPILNIEGESLSEFDDECRRIRNHYIDVKEQGFLIDLRDVEAVANHFTNWQKRQIKEEISKRIDKTEKTFPKNDYIKGRIYELHKILSLIDFL